jgi:signal transduction histidine kinase
LFVPRHRTAWREAMHNIVKHAHASQVDLSFDVLPDRVVLQVKDDGVGFDPLASYPGHLGLQSMRERVASLGGVLEIQSAPGQGTRICAEIPIKPSQC